MACYSLSPPLGVCIHPTVLGGASPNLVGFHLRLELPPWHLWYFLNCPPPPPMACCSVSPPLGDISAHSFGRSSTFGGLSFGTKVATQAPLVFQNWLCMACYRASAPPPHGVRKRKNMHRYVLISKKKMKRLIWFIPNSMVNCIGSSFLEGRGGGGLKA